MPISSLIASGIETLCNGFLSLDERSSDRRRLLTGKVLGICLRPFPQCYFVISETRVDVLSHFEGECDCELSLDLLAISQLSRPDAVVTLIKNETLDMSGDIKLAQQFAELFATVEVDLEEKLSRYMGDGPSHLFVGQLREVARALSGFFRSQASQMGEAIVDEYQLAVGRCEYQVFCHDIVVLEAELKHLDERIGGLDK